MDRIDEIRELLKLSPDEVRERAGGRMIVCPDLDALHQRMADDIAEEIQTNNSHGQPTRLILPVGPTAQYPLLADIANRERIALANCWFFFMDEYCDESGQSLPIEHPLSFRGDAQRLFLSRLDSSLGFRPENAIFPVPEDTDLDKLPALIEQVGGIDTCYGGVGIHGHVAFNEPEPGVKDTGPRRVRLNDYTVTINTIRSRVGGNLPAFPRYAYTLGMREVLGSRRIRLYCRNGYGLDWSNTVLRVALFGTPGDDYPVTYIRDHNYVIVTTEDTLASPDFVL
jgi:glucosamine-6-phosphate deaminase